MRRNTLVFPSTPQSLVWVCHLLNPVRGKQLLNQLSPGNTDGRSHGLGYRAKPAKTERERHKLNLRANRPGPGGSSWPEREWGLPGASVVENPPADAGDAGEVGSIPGSGRSSGEGKGNPLQCSCLENPRDDRAWWAAVYGVTQSRTQLKRLPDLPVAPQDEAGLTKTFQTWPRGWFHIP